MNMKLKNLVLHKGIILSENPEISKIQEIVNIIITKKLMDEAMTNVYPNCIENGFTKGDIENIIKWIKDTVSEEYYEKLQDFGVAWRDLSSTANILIRELFFKSIR